MQIFDLRSMMKPPLLLTMKTLKQTLIGSFLLVSFVLLSGCNTVKGIGEDFEAMGESIQDAGN